VGRLEMGELDEALADVVADATRAGDLIRRLRDWLRRGDVRREPLDLNEAIRALEPIARADALLHGIPLLFALAPAVPEVHGGRLWAERNPDGGLSVSFLIPEGRAAHECGRPGVRD